MLSIDGTTPSPEKYIIKSSFGKKNRGYSFGGINQFITRQSIDKTPGPAKYNVRLSPLKFSMIYSFGKVNYILIFRKKS